MFSWYDELRNLLDAVHNGIVAIDSDERVSIFNKPAERILGVPAQTALGKKITDVLSTSGLTTVLRSGKPEFGQQLEHNGVTVVTNRTPIISNGCVVGAVAVFQDVSELESLVSELRHVKELNKELEAILESFYDGIGIIAGDGTLLRVNTSYERITGLSKQENGVGRNVRELQADGTVSQPVALLVLNQKEPVTIKQKIKTGKEILITGSPVFDEKGEIFRVVCNIRDMTELNALKERIEHTELQNLQYASEIQALRARLHHHEQFIFRSAVMEKVFRLIVRVAGFNSHVLITGESGVGKEIAARLIHEFSPRAKAPFNQINCSAIPENLLESELFGYEEGAFTGARMGGKKGILEMCRGGTLLLDEIGELPINMQAKLLRVLQEHRVFRLGSTKPTDLDVRILASTNRNLEEMVAEGTFRADLFYRLNVVPIHIPPLRERPEDIVPLAIHFMERFNRKYGTHKRFDPEIFLAFERHPWSGNVRELENVVERLVVVNEEAVLNITHLPFAVHIQQQPLVVQVNELIPFEEALEILEKELLTKTIQVHHSTRKAAKVLGVTHPTIIRKLQKYKLETR